MTTISAPFRMLARALLAVLLAASSSELCARTLDGGVDNSFAISNSDSTLWAWGGNVGGKLGNGTTIYTSMPVPVSRSVTLGFAAGFYHTCSWNHETGEARCWGLNISGQLGDASNTDRWQSAPVSGLSSGVTNMSLGTWHSCAVTTNGAVKCWGFNGDGQLGYAGADSNIPVDVPALASGVTALAAGERHTCALTTAGGVKCWGNNTDGQLGNGNNAGEVNAVDVTGLSQGVASITSGLYHSCAVTTYGEARCWGRNASGQLGNGTVINSNLPVTPSGLSSGVATIVAGSHHTCAVLTTGAAKCWGWNGDAQLGDGTVVQKLVPTNVSGLSAFDSVAFMSAGFSHTCALTPGRQVLCWGRNTVGEVGDNTTTLRPVPTATWYMGANVGALASGGRHSCGVYKYPGTSGSYAYCWGENNHGQLGINSTANQVTPQYAYIPGLYTTPLYAASVSAGMSHTLAVDWNGRVWAWGSNQMGQLGVGKNRAPEACAIPFANINCSTLPIRVPGLPTVVAVGAGWGHSIALGEDGSVWAWGQGQFGQIGDGWLTTQYSPQRVLRWNGAQYVPLSGISQVAAGYFHSLALDGDGALHAWGRNNHGQLGTGTFTDEPWGAVPVPGTYATISAKGSHSLALTEGGTLWAWGLNAYGQVGNGSTFDVASPVSVRTGVTQISAGMTTSMAVGSSSPLAWGLNTAGQLGTSSAESCSGYLCQRTPKVLSGYSGAQGVAAAGAHGIVIRNDNSLALFGDNSVGQLGDRSGNYPGTFAQETFDPAGMLFPIITGGSGTSIGAGGAGTGLSLDNLGASIDFGLVAVGTNRDIGLTVTNLDPSPVTFSGIYASAPFTIVGNGCTGSISANGGSCGFSLRYSPTETPAQYGTLEIYSDAVDNETLRYGIVGSGVVAPTAPTAVYAVAYDGYAVVTFAAPSVDGGAPISHYTVTASPGGATTVGDSSSPASGITVDGLTNDVAYTFTVTATNTANLTSPPSAPSNSVTPRGPPNFVMTSSANPSLYGNPFTLTLTASGPRGVPSGTVTFRSDYVSLAGCVNVPLVAGVAQCTVNALAPGVTLLGVSYSGDPNYPPITWMMHNQKVNVALLQASILKPHAVAGGPAVDRPVILDTTQPANGNVTVDPRPIAAGQKILLEFSGPISFYYSHSVTPGTLASVFTGQQDKRLYTFANVPDGTRATITLVDVNGTGQDFSVSFGTLVGDVDGSRAVGSADVDAIKANAGKTVDNTSARYDIDLSGAITASDLLRAKGRLGAALP